MGLVGIRFPRLPLVSNSRDIMARQIIREQVEYRWLCVGKCGVSRGVHHYEVKECKGCGGSVRRVDVRQLERLKAKS